MKTIIWIINKCGKLENTYGIGGGRKENLNEYLQGDLEILYKHLTKDMKVSKVQMMVLIKFHKDFTSLLDQNGD